MKFQKSKIIIVDDHTLFREGIRLLIENENIGSVVAEADNGHAFLKLLNIHNPDLVLMDIEMPIMNGLEATESARKFNPNLKILVLTMQSSKADYYKMINAGVMGFVLKTAGKEELEKAILSVLAGEHYFSSEILKVIVSDLIKSPNEKEVTEIYPNEITEREMDVLKLLCQGLTTSEIAGTIHRSIKTVEAHRAKLLEKTHTKNSINLVLFAIKNKLVEI